MPQSAGGECCSTSPVPFGVRAGLAGLPLLSDSICFVQRPQNPTSATKLHPKGHFGSLSGSSLKYWRCLSHLISILFSILLQSPCPLYSTHPVYSILSCAKRGVQSPSLPHARLPSSHSSPAKRQLSGLIPRCHQTHRCSLTLLPQCHGRRTQAPPTLP